MKRIFLILHWLNFDTALGAVITSLYITKTLGSFVSGVTFLALGLSVLAIYNFDHLMDAGKIQNLALSRRHRFYQKHFKLLSVYELLLLLALIFIVWYIPPAIAKAGIVLALIALIYFLLLFVVLPNRFILKELFISTVFVSGLFLAPLASQEYFEVANSTFLLAVQFFLLAIVNTLIFSWFDYDIDIKERHSSLARVLGKRMTYNLSLVLLSLLGLIIVISLIGAVDYLSQVIMALMALVLLLTLKLNKWISSNEVYRIVGEAIFIIPLIALL